jgi:hypothetical protein
MVTSHKSLQQFLQRTVFRTFLIPNSLTDCLWAINFLIYINMHRLVHMVIVTV